MEQNAPISSAPTTPVSPVSPPPTPVETPTTPDPVARFRGLGTNFRAKLIGIDDVPDSRGDQMCQESILKLKAAVVASGRHKQKIIVNVSLEGIKIVDVMTGEVQHVHPVHRISFIARDTTDRRAFGYVYGAEEGRHQFYGVKTAKAAEALVVALRDLFQVVYDMKKKEIDEAKAAQDDEHVETSQQVISSQSSMTQPPVQGPPAQSNENIMDLKQQLTNIQEGINNMDAIGPWSNEANTFQEAGGSEQNNDMFGLADTAPLPRQNSSYSEDLFSLGAPAAQPAPQPGAKLTNDQILYGFGGVPQHQQQQQMFAMVQQGMSYQPASSAPMPAFQAASYPQMGAPRMPAVGAFPSGPSPVIPPRPGAMRPPAPHTLPQGSNQNPFGDAFSGQAPMLTPASSNSNAAASSQEPQAPSDPFASLIPGMGAANSASANKKDMFKNYQMSKPPQPPPRTNPPPKGAEAMPIGTNADQSSFDSYFLQSVGGVPLPSEPNATANQFGVPSDNSNQPFGFPQNGVNGGTSLFG